MDKLLKLIDGKKTYISAILIGLGAAATAMGYVIPEWVWALLGAIGLGSVRAAIKK
jgi:hypothetical protein